MGGFMKILVVEDEKKVRQFLKKGLSGSDIVVDTAENLEELFSSLLSISYDAIVLDRLLSGIDSLPHISDIRKKAPQTKILVLSALSEVEEKIEGLNSGADDYLAKPFNISELVARLRALCRRADTTSQNNILRLQDLTLNLDTQGAERGGQRLQLTAKEYKLLALLVKRPDRIYSKSELLNQVWEIQYYPESNVVEVLVNHLRSKVDKGFSVKLIHSKRGVGYWAGSSDL